MKINVEFDLSPEEFRQLMGWPDVQNINEAFINQWSLLKDQENSNLTFNIPAHLKDCMASGVNSFDLFQKLFFQSLKNPPEKPNSSD